MSKKKKIVLTSIIITICLICFGLFIYFYKDIQAIIANEEFLGKLEDFIDSLGIFGVVVMILMMITQIVIAFLPGEPFELAAGVMYGTFGGLIVSLIACFIGSSIVFLLVRKFGKKLTMKFFTEEKLSKYKFIGTAHNRNKLLFIIFLLPGTPKDLLTYFAPLTPIKYGSYIFIATIARIPSIISSTMAGHSLISGNLNATMVIYAITFGITGIGVIIDSLIQKHRNKQKETQN